MVLVLWSLFNHKCKPNYKYFPSFGHWGSITRNERADYLFLAKMWEVGEGNVLNQFLELYLKNIHFCDKIAWCAWDIRFMRVCAKIVSTQSVSWTYPDKTLILWQNCLVCMSCVRCRVYVSIYYLIRFSSLNFQICKFRELQEN